MNIEDEEIVFAFMKAVYPGFSDLALATFSETIALRDATQLIGDLRMAVLALKAQCDNLTARIKDMEDDAKEARNQTWPGTLQES